MISSKFPKSFRGARDFVVFYELFFVIFWGFLDLKEIIQHHQVTSTLKTLRKLAWNHLTVFWLNFEKNQRFLFLYDHSPLIMVLTSFLRHRLLKGTKFQRYRPFVLRLKTGLELWAKPKAKWMSYLNEWRFTLARTQKRSIRTSSSQHSTHFSTVSKRPEPTINAVSPPPAKPKSKFE